MYQLELFEKVIEVKIVTSSGQMVNLIAISDVQDFLTKIIQKKRLWLYIDGINFNSGKITRSIILSSKEIILTKALIGG